MQMVQNSSMPSFGQPPLQPVMNDPFSGGNFMNGDHNRPMFSNTNMSANLFVQKSPEKNNGGSLFEFNSGEKSTNQGRYGSHDKKSKKNRVQRVH